MKRILALVVIVAVLLGSAGCGSDLPAKPAEYLLVRPPGEQLSPRDAVRLDTDKTLAFGPHVGLAAAWIMAAAEVDAEEARKLDLGGGMRAADGHEFVFVGIANDLRYTKGRWGRAEAGTKLAAEVVVDGRTRPLNAVPEPGSMLIVSVPERAAGRLTITDDGRPMSIDLRTGEPEGGLGTIFRHRTSADYEGSGRIATSAGSRSLDVDIKVEEATLEPYLPGLGWGRPGRAWLRLTLAQVSSNALQQSTADEPVVGFFIDPAATFALSAQGATMRPKAGLAFNTMRLTARYMAVIDAPASLRTGELRVAPDGPLFMYRGTSMLTDYMNLTRVPDCGPRLRAVCLQWAHRPRPQVIKLALS